MKDSINDDSSGIKPYMESSTIPKEELVENQEAAYDGPRVRTINRENFKDLLNENKLTVIAVFARKCSACKEIEPKLAALQKQLIEEVGHKKVGVVKMDIFNEVHFLKQVDRTPSFLLHEKKGNYFWDLGTSDFDEITKTADRIYKKSYRY